MLGVKYALAVNSCSSAIMIALRAAGAKIGAKVLVPAFTFTAVPSAIVNVGAVPVLVEVNPDYRVDLDDLIMEDRPRREHLPVVPHARADLQSRRHHGHLRSHGVTLIEDAAHGLGALWAGKPVGSFGKIGCFSFQSAKIVNAGEGGILTTNDPEIMAKAVILSGAYEALHEKHFWSEDLQEYLYEVAPAFAALQYADERVHRSVVRPPARRVSKESRDLPRHITAYLTAKLSAEDRVEFPESMPQELRAPDSVQFRVRGFSPRRCGTSWHRSRRPVSRSPRSAQIRKTPGRPGTGISGHVPDVPLTRLHLAGACDMRLPSTLTDEHLDFFTDAVLTAIREVEETS